MFIKIGLILNESQINIKSLNTTEKTIETNTISFEELKELDLNILFFEEIENLESVAQLLKEQEEYYPIVDINSAQVSTSQFENSNYDELKNIFEKINTRWILANNIQTIESLCSEVANLKELWIKDRNQFFKNFWMTFKRNLASTELNIIFHDLKELTEAQKEKGEKPSLCYSFIKGNKIPELQAGTDTEKSLMSDYKSEFNQNFNITEYDSGKGQLVICSQLEKSPILIMATVPNLNQLQRSVLISIVNGLNA